MGQITINDALSYFDTQCPNQFSPEDKIKWLSECDENIYQNIISVREGAEDVKFEGYNEETPLNTKLLVPTPYTEIYRYFLEKSVNYANREMGAFNNAVMMYQTYYDNYFAFYNREHKRNGKRQFRI